MVSERDFEAGLDGSETEEDRETADDFEASERSGGGADFIPWTCAVCGESNEVFVEPDAGLLQELTEDCTTCCRPHTIRVRVGRGGSVRLEVHADGEE
jgi:hypothetical protein